LGVSVASDGRIDSVMWGSPAFQSGLVPGMQMAAVHREAYKAERLAAAVRGNRDGRAPIELIVKDGERYLLMSIDYRGGLRYPKLERVKGSPDRLAQIYSPLP
jgi:predicted metalloprotease with PDZ domain